MKTEECLPTIRSFALALLFPILCSTASCAQTSGHLAEVRTALQSGNSTATDVLTASKYIDLHGDPAFRKLIREHAPKGRIAITSSEEPGTRVILKGSILGKDRKPRAGVLFYFYHTMHDGLYAVNRNEPGKPFNGQQEVARLFGYLRTDDAGRFEIHTIKPAGYPGEKFPAHVHVEIYGDDGAVILGTEFQFADDPRLTKEMQAESIRFGNLVAGNSGTRDRAVYDYNIVLPEGK